MPERVPLGLRKSLLLKLLKQERVLQTEDPEAQERESILLQCQGHMV